MAQTTYVYCLQERPAGELLHRNDKIIDNQNILKLLENPRLDNKCERLLTVMMYLQDLGSNASIQKSGLPPQQNPLHPNFSFQNAPQNANLYCSEQPNRNGRFRMLNNNEILAAECIQGQRPNNILYFFAA